MLRLNKATFLYEPYPIGMATEVFDEAYYNQLIDSFPPTELFKFMKFHGNKYSLSEHNCPDNYQTYVRSHEPWLKLYEWIKRDEFPFEILDMLRVNHIDLGIQRKPSNLNQKGVLRRLLHRGTSEKRSRLPFLKSRFEFSMLPANEGSIRPHTDDPSKIVTLVIPIVREGEWNPSFGGGTEALRPKNSNQNFNFLNKYLEFDDVETVKTFEYEPNRCIIFIKTFNSLHGVRPMKGYSSEMMRKTVTINIENLN